VPDFLVRGLSPELHYELRREADRQHVTMGDLMRRYLIDGVIGDIIRGAGDQGDPGPGGLEKIRRRLKGE
jgi:hypothetical protein